MTNAQTKPDHIVVYSADWCPDCRRAKQFLGEHRIQYEHIDMELHPESIPIIKALNNGAKAIPTIVFPDGDVLTEPSNAELAAKLGISTQASQSFYDVVIIGAGPAGLTAALYLGREGQNVLVIDKAGIGGQAGVTQVLDNFPGFDEGIGGAEFADRLGRQVERFGAEIIQAQEVVGMQRNGRYWCVATSDGTEYGATAVLITTGAKYRRLNAPGENALIGINIHFCATCDGAFYKKKKVLVIGGGNSGFEEGLFLTKFADQVDIVEFMPQVIASQVLQDKVAEQPNMNVIVNHAVKEFVGDGSLDHILVEDRATGEVHEWHYDGVFVFIGLSPNSGVVKDLVEIAPGGFITTSPTLMSSEPGLFAAGDVRLGSTKQAVSAAGEGATAALMIRQYISSLDS